MATAAVSESQVHQKSRTPSDIPPNMNQIRSSKLFKKFLATEQSEDGNRSGENTNRGFQESPFVSKVIAGTGEFDAVQQRSNVKIPLAHKNSNLRGSSNESKQSNLNMSNVSGISNFQHISHSYFQPPTPQYATNTTTTAVDLHALPEISPNLSQYVLDNHRKQHFSPERFYFNAAANPAPGNQTILEDEREIQGQSQNLSRSFVRTPGVQQQQQQQQSAYQDGRSFNPPPFNGQDGQDEIMHARMGVNSQYAKSPQMQQQQQYQDDDNEGVSTNVPGSSYTEKKRGPMYQTGSNLRNSKSTFMGMSQDPRALEQDWRNMQEQLYQYECNAQHLGTVLEAEMNKNHALEGQIAQMRQHLAGLEAVKADSERKQAVEVDRQLREIEGLKKNVVDNEKKLTDERGETEKVREMLDKQKELTSKAEEQARNAGIQIKQFEEAAQEFKRRQEKRDDEILAVKLQFEQLQAKYATMSLSYERASEKLDSSSRSQLREVEEKEENSRRIAEQSTKLQNFLVENERLRNENYSLNRQLHENNLRTEMIASDLAHQKQMSFEKSQKDSMNAVSIDRANFEIHNLRNLLARTEVELRDVKAQNSHLLKNIQNMSITAALSTTSSHTTPIPAASAAYMPQDFAEINQPPQYSTQTYQRGRLESQRDNRQTQQYQSEEEVKMNSPDRLRYKPKDTNIFGSSLVSGYGNRNDLFLSPSTKTEMIRPRDNNVFGTNITDDTYQRNPMKIGHSSLSPQRMQDVTSRGQVDLPAAGQRKRSLRVQGNQGFSPNKSNTNLLENNLALMNQDRQLLENELRKIEDMKRKTGADIRRKTEISRELEQLEQMIAEHRTQLRNGSS